MPNVFAGLKRTILALLRRRQPQRPPAANPRRHRSRAEEYLTATAAYHH